MPERTEGYPKIDTLESVASLLGREVWELLHPDIERAIKERQIYDSVMGLVSSSSPHVPPAYSVHDVPAESVAPIPQRKSTPRKKRA